MDQERFDRFTKAMATGHSRRSILRGMGASIATAMAGLGLGNASANHGGVHRGGPKPGRCGEAGQPCKFGTHCCSGTCLNGYCACPDGQELVNGVCQPIDPCAGVVCEDDGNECTTSICVDGTCESQVLTDSPCDGGTGICDASGVCQPNDPCAGVVCEDDLNQCTQNICVDGTCESQVLTGAPCLLDDFSLGICDASAVCQPIDPCTGFCF